MGHVIIMKNGDIVNLESYDWNTYRSPGQFAMILRELSAKAEQCKNKYPGQKVSFCFNSEFGAVPDAVKKTLEPLGVEIQTWP